MVVLLIYINGFVIVLVMVVLLLVFIIDLVPVTWWIEAVMAILIQPSADKHACEQQCVVAGSAGQVQQGTTSPLAAVDD